MRASGVRTLMEASNGASKGDLKMGPKGGPKRGFWGPYFYACWTSRSQERVGLIFSDSGGGQNGQFCSQTPTQAGDSARSRVFRKSP